MIAATPPNSSAAQAYTNTKERTAFVDTFYIRFYNNNTADTKEGRSVMISGTSEIFTDDYITTSAADFKIVSVSPDVIVLDDMRGYQHSLSRTNHFAYETGNEPPPTPANNADNKVDLSPSSLIKNWFAYRRAADPGVVKAGTPLIRYLRIQEKISADRYKAEVEFARNGKAYVQQCILTFTDKTVLIETEGSTWNIQVYKADGKEMILGTKGELIYYFTNLDQ